MSDRLQSISPRVVDGFGVPRLSFTDQRGLMPQIGELHRSTAQIALALARSMGTADPLRVHAHPPSSDQITYVSPDKIDLIASTNFLNSPFIRILGYAGGEAKYFVEFNLPHESFHALPSTQNPFTDALQLRDALEGNIQRGHLEENVSIVGPTEEERFVVLQRRDQKPVLEWIQVSHRHHADVMGVIFTPYLPKNTRPLTSLAGGITFLTRFR